MFSHVQIAPEVGKKIMAISASVLEHVLEQHKSMLNLNEMDKLNWIDGPLKLRTFDSQDSNEHIQ